MNNKTKLLILWTNADAEVAKKLVLLYGSVILPREYWQEAHLMVWGPSIKLLAENEELQEMLKKVLDTGVKASTCVVCSDDYNYTDKMRELGVEPNHTGELFTEALKSDEWAVITI